MRSTSRFSLALALAATGILSSSCSGTGGEAEPPKIERGLFATPEMPVFVCVTPGCDTSQRVTVRVLGDRRIAIKRVLLEGASKDDFTLAVSQQAPFILGVDGTFDIEVRHVPLRAPAPEDSHILISYTDASAEESPDRIQPGELRIPLARRLVGEPWLKAEPASLSFGAVAVNGSKTLPLRLANVGVGNVALTVTSAEPGAPEFEVSLPDPSTLLPGASLGLEVTYRPTRAAYSRTELEIRASPETVRPIHVVLEGTSVGQGQLAVEPGTSIDLGQVPRGSTKLGSLTLVNQGGKRVTVSAIRLTDTTRNLSASPAADVTLPFELEPLQRMPLAVELRGNTPGPVRGTLAITSSASQAATQVSVSALVTEPKLELAPGTVDFGTVPVGWVVPKTVELRNVGSGALTIKNIQMVAGSSTLFSIAQLPSLPLVLEPEKRVALDVEFRSETSATFTGSLSVESNGVENFLEVPLRAVGGSCSASCPISNGTASCTSGRCSVGSCNDGYFNADGRADNGCECREVSTGGDPGGTCLQAVAKGTLKDDGAVTSHSGVLPVGGDEDFIRFFGADTADFATDYYFVDIRLESRDPNIQMCVYRYDTGDPTPECNLTNEVCPSDNVYQRPGAGLSSDSAEYVVKVFRRANTAPTCTPYTVHIKNG